MISGYLKYSRTIFTASCVSLLISLCTEIIKRKLEQDESFKIPQICDEKCENILKSQYSVGFGFNFLPDALKISNSLYGIFYYAIVASLSFSERIGVVEIQLFLSSLSIWMSLYLTYVLIYVLKEYCILCISVHLVNVVTITFIGMKYRHSLKMKKTKVF